ncbi:hypothetical protein JCGZ_26512 [Jatropha curcas]|uniref:Uncharacterized protein n=1 Tax=Jatropha curcas TaxID=180498 RepID=A0A067JXE2_JATCU|nr:hypothetical protein JCGZ_26512 [Jatropha curcas]
MAHLLCSSPSKGQPPTVEHFKIKVPRGTKSLSKNATSEGQHPIVEHFIKASYSTDSCRSRRQPYGAPPLLFTV